MLVTIITPSFNQGKYIETTIKSVINQSYEHIEYIIIDACSSDSTIEVLNRYKNHPKVSKIICEKDRGQADAINKGFIMAKGEIVGWINSDDYLHPNIVETSVNAFKEDNSIGITYGNITVVDKKNNKIKEVHPYPFLTKFFLLNKNYDVYQPGSFYRKNFVKNTSYLNEALFYAMDLDLWLKLLDDSKAKYLNQTAAYFRWYLETKTSTGGLGYCREILATINKHGAQVLPASKRKLYWYALKAFIKGKISQ